MKNKQIQEFFAKVVQDKDFKYLLYALQEKAKISDSLEEESQEFIKKVLIPKAKALGYTFTENDLTDFFMSHEFTSFAKLSTEELENVSGGSLSAALIAGLAILGGWFWFGGGQQAPPPVEVAAQPRAAANENPPENELNKFNSIDDDIDRFDFSKSINEFSSDDIDRFDSPKSMDDSDSSDSIDDLDSEENHLTHPRLNRSRDDTLSQIEAVYENLLNTLAFDKKLGSQRNLSDKTTSASDVKITKKTGAGGSRQLAHRLANDLQSIGVDAYVVYNTIDNPKKPFYTTYYYVGKRMYNADLAHDLQYYQKNSVPSGERHARLLGHLTRSELTEQTREIDYNFATDPNGPEAQPDDFTTKAWHPTETTTPPEKTLHESHSPVFEQVKTVYHNLLKTLEYDEEVGKQQLVDTEDMSVADRFASDVELTERTNKGVCRQISHRLIRDLSEVGLQAYPLIIPLKDEINHIAVLYFVDGEPYVADLSRELEFCQDYPGFYTKEKPLLYKFSLNDYKEKENNAAAYFYLDGDIRDYTDKELTELGPHFKFI